GWYFVWSPPTGGASIVGTSAARTSADTRTSGQARLSAPGSRARQARTRSRPPATRAAAPRSAIGVERSRPATASPRAAMPARPRPNASPASRCSARAAGSARSARSARSPAAAAAASAGTRRTREVIEAPGSRASRAGRWPPPTRPGRGGWRADRRPAREQRRRFPRCARETMRFVLAAWRTSRYGAQACAAWWPQATNTRTSAANPSTRPSSRTVAIPPYIPASIAPPMPALAGIRCRSFISPGRVTAPAGAWPSHAVHQLDRQLDGCALPEKVEENLHPSAPGARPLHDRDQPHERAALDLHPIPRPERRERSDDTPFARTGGDEPDHAVLDGGGPRAEGDEAAHAGRPDHSVVVLEERDVHEEVAREEGRYLVTPPLEDAGQEDRDPAPLELLHRVVLLPRLGAGHVPLTVLTASNRERCRGRHTEPAGRAISVPRRRPSCSRGSC